MDSLLWRRDCGYLLCSIVRLWSDVSRRWWSGMNFQYIHFCLLFYWVIFFLLFNIQRIECVKAWNFLTLSVTANGLLWLQWYCFWTKRTFLKKKLKHLLWIFAFLNIMVIYIYMYIYTYVIYHLFNSLLLLYIIAI